MLLSKLNAHSFDKRIKLQHEGHIYYIDGDSKNVISGTTIIHKYFGNFNAVEVIKNIINGENYKDPEYKYYNMTEKQIKQLWDKNGKEASTAGTKLHEDIEFYLNKEDRKNNTVEFNQFLEFLNDNKQLVPYRTEWMVFIEKLKVCGSIDCVFINDDGTLSLCDWKRSKSINFDNMKKAKHPFDNIPDCNFYQYSMQLNLYRHILENYYDFKVKDMFLVVLHPENEDGKYQFINVKRMEKEINLLLNIRDKELNNITSCNEDDIEDDIIDENIQIKSLLRRKPKKPQETYTQEVESLKFNSDSSKSQDNKGKRWTKEEDDELMKNAKNGNTLEQLSAIHKRSSNALKMRIMSKYEEFKGEMDDFCKIYNQINEQELIKFFQFQDKKNEERKTKKLDSVKKEKKINKPIKKIEEEKKIQTNIKLSKNGLSERQQKAYDLIVNGENVFLTGAAGCGKSYIIKEIYRFYLDRKQVAITSTTGTSAILIDGVTLHSYLGIGLGNASAESLILMIKKNSQAYKRWRDLDILIIDEISMLSPILFDKLEMIGRYIRKQDVPFGGIQLILSGDFLQLPVVGEIDSFCFDASTWNKCIKQENIIYLNENFRQSDALFRKCLDEIRIGNMSEETISILKSKVGAKLENDLGILPTKLYSLNRDVDFENNNELDKLVSKNENLSFIEYELKYDVLKHGLRNVEEKLKKSCNAPFIIQLCVGAQVMLLYNLDLEQKLVNGSRGVIVHFESEFPKVRFLNGVEMLITPKTWTLEENGESILQWTQIPLKVAFAISTHKSQGMTIDYAEVDLSNIFENSQAYVALSRVKSLQGLSIKNYNSLCIRSHPRAIDFYKKLS